MNFIGINVLIFVTSSPSLLFFIGVRHLLVTNTQVWRLRLSLDSYTFHILLMPIVDKMKINTKNRHKKN